MNILGTKTPLIIHGHFYQPPREDPRVDRIGYQSSAAPYDNWNEQIYDTCYRPNVGSRYLNAGGEIKRIINNLEYISFNFGPTLLQWLERHHPVTHQQIVNADKKSVERLGYGNALAQSFNHTILPLDTPADARLQIEWGIDDFVARFQRQPAGLWLPETAINHAVIDLLIDHDISFVLLSPWQCESWEAADGSWWKSSQKPVPYDRPFILEGSNGKHLYAFFYHGDLSAGISFSHLLRDADALYRRLKSLQATDQPELIHAATDGEIYGHHEPFGDMALAALIVKTQEREDFELTNYTTYLQNHQPKQIARLFPGEEEKGSSWSCVHGVSRWYKDCGCTTGGEDRWNQKWRTPLRQAFSDLAVKLDLIYHQKISAITQGKLDPYALLRSYGSVMSNFSSTQAFLQQECASLALSEEEYQQIAQLLAGQKFKHLSFTSCGWFFADIGGLEASQNIAYALQAAQLYANFTDKDLLQPLLATLAQAKSNRKTVGNGANIARRLLAAVAPQIEAASYFFFNVRLAHQKESVNRYGKFHLLSSTHADQDTDWVTVELLDSVTLRHYQVKLMLDTNAPSGIRLRWQDGDSALEQSALLSDFLPTQMINEIFIWLDRSLSNISDEDVLRIASEISHYNIFLKAGSGIFDAQYQTETMGVCLRALRSILRVDATHSLSWPQRRDSVASLLNFIRKRGDKTDLKVATTIFSTELSRLATEIEVRGYQDQLGCELLERLRLAYNYEFQPEITAAQNALYPYLGKKGAWQADLVEQLRKELNFA